MTCTFTLITTESGFGYIVSEGDRVLISQEFKPGVEGFEAMTEEEATALAQAEVDALNSN